MSETLGEAVLDLEADLTPLDRDLAEAERRTALWLATTQAMVDRGMGPISQRMGMVGQAFDRELTPPLQRFGSATERMAKQVDGSLAQTRLEQAATAREAERMAAIAVAGGRAQVEAADRSSRAYAEEALAAKLSADEQEAAAARALAARAAFGAGGYPTEPHAPPAGSLLGARAVEERLAVGGGSEGEVWGVRGPRAAGSVGNPVVMVMEAASRTGLGSLAAAIGESSASGGARSAVVAEGGGGPSPTTIVASSGGSGGGGVPPIAVAPGGSSPGGGGGGFLGGVGLAELMGRGGGGGGRPPGWLGYVLGPALGATAAAGSAGSFAGFGAEHLLMTLLGLGGSAVGAGIGGGLLAAGSAGQIVVGGGSDLAVMKSTITDTKALAEGYDNVEKAVKKYGAGSKQAAMAQHELNMLMEELGNTAGVKAEAGLAKQAEQLNEFWNQQTSGARVQAVGILSQFVTLAHEYVPRVAAAAEVNLGVINAGVKPLLSWLSGPQGLGIFNNLEDRFRAQLPTAVHAGTQALELFLRVIDVASQYTGGFTRSVDRLFTRLNGLDKASLSGWVGKFVADFRMWETLIKVVGEDLYLLFTRDAGTAGAIVTGITHALERAREWEKSTKGGAQIQSIFMVHKEQIEALGHLIPPLVGAFSKLYLAVAPTAVEATITLMTKVLLPFVEALSFVASQGKAAALAMGLLLVSFKAFGVGSTLSGLKGMFGWLTGATAADAAAANADAAANTRLAASLGEVAAAGGAAAAGETAASAGGAAGGLLGGAGLLGRLGGRATGAVEGGSLGLAGMLEKVGLGGLALRVAGMGGALAPVAGVALPALAAGGAGYLASNFVSNATGLHGQAKGALEGVATGAVTGAVIGSAVPVLGTAVGAVAGGAIGGAIGLLTGSRGQQTTVELKSMAEAGHEGSKRLGELIAQIERVKSVKVAGIAEPYKQVVAQLKLAKHAQDEWNASWNKSWEAVHKFSVGSGPLLKALFDRFDTNFRSIAHTMGLNSGAGRKLAQENISQMVDHIGRAMHDGKISADSGMSAISNIIAKYTKATGDQTPKIYEQMFTHIDTLYKRGEVGTKTAFRAFSSIASSETHHMVSEVETKQRDMFAHLKTLYDNGEITTKQYHSRERSLATHTASVVEGAMVNMSEGVIGAIESGALSTKDGLSIIGKNLNQLLVQFGGKPLPLPKLEAYVAVVGANKAAGNAVKGITEGFAGGGVVQFGNPGERGHDSIFLNMGGSDIAVAPGEVGAVFTHHQLPEVNAALEERGWGGGLDGLFHGVTTPHYMAQGGAVRRRYAKGGYAGYSLPLPRGSMMPGSWSIDQGVDIPAAAGTPEFAIGPGQIVMEGISGFGPNAPVLRIDQGPLAGMSVYYGHAGRDRVKVGAHVAAGQQISEVGAGIVGISSGPHIEIGFGPPFGRGDHMAQVLRELLGGAGVAGVAGGAATAQLHAPGIGGPGAIAAIARAGLKKATGAANKYLGAHVSAGIGPAGVHGIGASSGGHAAGNAQMRAWARAGLIAAGLPGTDAEVSTIVYTMSRESGGNPRSENTTDSNARAGHPSRGLMELIPENFAKYHVRGTSNDVFDPVANVAAAVRYMIARYGHIVGMSPYSRGGLIASFARGGMFAPGGVVARTAAAPKVGKPKGVKHVPHTKKPGPMSLKHLTTTLAGIPGMQHIGADLGPQEGTYNLLTDEQSLLSSMQSNPASILQADMAYLSPTLAPGENIGPGMLVPRAERELQRTEQRLGETPGLQLQGSLLQWIGGLDDHRLLTGPDVGVLAKDFHSTAGHVAIAGVPLGVGYPIFKGQQSVLEAQLHAQVALARIMRQQKDRAAHFIRVRARRKQRLERLLRAVYARYRNIQRRLQRLRTAGLRRRLSEAQRHHAAQVAHQEEVEDASAHRSALRDAIASEKELNPWEQNHAMLQTWQTEERHLSGVVAKPPPSTSAISNAAEALQRNELTNEGKALGEQMHLLGGASTSIGTGGEIGVETKQLSGLHSGVEELDGKIRTAVQSTIPQIELSIAQIKDALGEEAESVAPKASPTTLEQPGGGELASLLKQQNEQLAQQLAVSQAQYKVFAGLGDLPPFAGRFHSGGVVPGPLGAERMALVQGGEVISQPGGGNYEANVHVADGMGWLKDLIRVEVRQATRGSARKAGSALPSRGGGQL